MQVSGGADVLGTICTPSWCRFISDIAATDERLSGCFLLPTAGGTATGTWGTVAFRVGTQCDYGFGFQPQGAVTWEGDWFTAGSRAWKVAEGGGGIAPSAIYPVAAIWLHGLGEYQGLSAILRMSAPGRIDGWLFPTPSQP